MHLPPPQSADRPHYGAAIPNEMHQLICCICTVIHYTGISISISCPESMSLPDTKSPGRYDRQHLQVGLLTFPKVFQCDNGSEFRGEVTKTFEKNEVMIRHVTTKYKHTHTAFVEALNKLLAEQLFKVTKS